MSKITAGKIITHIDDEKRDLAREALAPIRERGLAAGSFIVEMDRSSAVRVDLGARDVALIERVEDLLEQVVASNPVVVTEVAGGDDPGELADIAWFILSPVRLVGYGEGEYTVNLPGGFVLRYEVTPAEVALLERFDQLLEGIIEDNHLAIDQILTSERQGMAA